MRKPVKSIFDDDSEEEEVIPVKKKPVAKAAKLKKEGYLLKKGKSKLFASW